MNRRFTWAILVVAGIVLGFMSGTLRRTVAAPPPAPAESEIDPAEQLKEIRTQVKEINELLHSGTLRVVVVINPDKTEKDDKSEKE